MALTSESRQGDSSEKPPQRRRKAAIVGSAGIGILSCIGLIWRIGLSQTEPSSDAVALGRLAVLALLIIVVGALVGLVILCVTGIRLEGRRLRFDAGGGRVISLTLGAEPTARTRNLMQTDQVSESSVDSPSSQPQADSSRPPIVSKNGGPKRKTSRSQRSKRRRR
jgi:hypothetical protein